jgi:hypothetical protein
MITAGPTLDPATVASGGTTSATVEASSTGAEPVSLAWSADCGALGSGSFGDASAAMTSFTAPQNTSGSDATCTLSVTASAADAIAAMGMADLTVEDAGAFAVTITAGPSADPNPVASAAMSALSVTAEAGGDTLAFAWSAVCPEGITGDSFDNAAVANPSWTAPANPGPLPVTCQLSVAVSSSTDSVAAGFDLVVGPLIVASILPVSRSVQVGQLATAFGTIINAGAGSALNCGIALGDNPGLSGEFFFQITDPADNALAGNPDSPIDIAPGPGTQTYVFGITPDAPFEPASVALSFLCDNAEAGQLPAINTLFFSASVDPVPDLVALVASLEPGFVTLPSPSDTGVFSVAAANVGVAGEILAQPATELLGAGQPLPLSLLICQTGLNGLCLGTPAASVTTMIEAEGTPSFAVFVTGQGEPIAQDLVLNRVFVTFAEGGILRGATSLAVRTAP